MIATVLDITQQAVFAVIKRSRGWVVVVTWPLILRGWVVVVTWPLIPYSSYSVILTPYSLYRGVKYDFWDYK
jgi:hypothetical protein